MDYFVFQQINSLAGKFVCLDSLGIYLAEHFEHVLWFCLVLFLLKNLRKYWSMIIKGLAAGILARFGIVELIRFLWERPRPFIENNVNLLVEAANKASFPSGHAAFYFALSTVIFLYNKKAGILFFIASFLISISRVFVGIHWPLDILAGALVGIFSGWLILKILKR